MVNRYLTENPYSRPGRRLVGVKAIVMHNTGVPRQSAQAVRQFYEQRKNGKTGYGSAHAVIGLKGEVIRLMHTYEMAYGCGIPDFEACHKDPDSGRFYTDYARRQFGEYAIDFRHKSPNQCTLNIEMCQIDSEGNFSDETLTSAASYVKSLVGFYGLAINTDCITTHHNVVGWKACPLLWTNHPEKLGEFVEMVREA